MSTVTNEAYRHGYQLLALDRPLPRHAFYEMPQGWDVHDQMRIGRRALRVCASISEDLSDQSRTCCAATWASTRRGCHSCILRGRWTWQRRGRGLGRRLLGYMLNDKRRPSYPAVASGDNRIWGLDMTTGDAWQLRPGEEEAKRSATGTPTASTSAIMGRNPTATASSAACATTGANSRRSPFPTPPATFTPTTST
ncbi:MAG: hypothetical protein R3A10_22245 [Caldilineaceae bacterium]